MRTIALLPVSNIFMTAAWYGHDSPLKMTGNHDRPNFNFVEIDRHWDGHLRFKNTALWLVILVSWLIAFVEYCFQVPANRIGSYQFSTAQLKTIQEVITLVVFCGFSVLYLKEELKWNYLVGFGFMIIAVFFVFKKWA